MTSRRPCYQSVVRRAFSEAHGPPSRSNLAVRACAHRLPDTSVGIHNAKILPLTSLHLKELVH